jgi:hypothetical protein
MLAPTPNPGPKFQNVPTKNDFNPSFKIIVTHYYWNETVKSTPKAPIPQINLSLSLRGYWKCMFVDFLTGYIGPSNCVHC